MYTDDSAEEKKCIATLRSSLSDEIMQLCSCDGIPGMSLKTKDPIKLSSRTAQGSAYPKYSSETANQTVPNIRSRNNKLLSRRHISSGVSVRSSKMVAFSVPFVVFANNDTRPKHCYCIAYQCKSANNNLGLMCFFGFSPWPYVKMVFPVIILLLLPFRHKIVPVVIDQKYLEALDGENQ
ncbi:unnamed protein product [Medioppia subpectinata]|uniref:Uncharacterized protein n=1 Tax=Medioppia subpectinata TaxID=1979941 RepID=A0A7R9PY49_9ACAR|nr:unnamed protein product [Medioppia subpectinata]CAG2105509.1 unnamed protein product [Medioppia subpectinata]